METAENYSEQTVDAGLTGLAVDKIYRIGYEPVWSVEPLDKVTFERVGIKNDRHSGVLRTCRPYESGGPAGVVIPNDRQISLVDTHDMLAVAEGLNLPIAAITERAETSIERFMACQLAANVLLSGEVSLNHIARPGALLALRTAANVGPVVQLNKLNEPCKKAVTKLLHSLGALGLTLDQDFATLKAQFMGIAANRRGWVGFVHSPGTLFAGASVTVEYPADN